MKLVGRVYLLHFVVDPERAGPLGKARHYVGFARRGNLMRRLEAHRRGRGARLTKTLFRLGGDFVLVRTWEGGLALEKRLKRRGPKRLCHLCNKEALR